MLTQETMEFRGSLRSMVSETVADLQSRLGVRDVEQVRAMFARALTSPLVREDLIEQCEFYLNGDELIDPA